MADDRNDPVIRKGALLLSALVLTPSEGLGAYRDRRVANKDVDLETLEKARAVLDAVGFVLRSESQADWRKLEKAYEALRGVKAPAEAVDTKAPSTVDESSDEPPGKPTPSPAPPVAAAPAVARPPSPAPPPVALDPPAVRPPSPAPPPVAPAPAQAMASAAPIPPSPVASPPPVAPAPAPAPAPMPSSPVASAPPAPVETSAFAESVETTAFVAALDEGITLPFEAVDVAEAPEPVADKLPPQAANIDETAALGVALNLDDVLPFDGAKASEPPERFTLEQYASLCAERDLAGQANLHRVLARYGVADVAALRALDAKWAERLRDLTVHARFDQLRERYRQWLAQPRG